MSLIDPANAPFLANVQDFNREVDPVRVEQSIEIGTERCRNEIPPRFADAAVTHESVAQWVVGLIENASQRWVNPKITSGDSLLITGGVGVGKTHQAYGAVRALAASGASCIWRYVRAADLYGTLRDYDRGGVEQRLEEYANTAVLFLDDLGSEKWTEAKEEINYRLLNYRYEHKLPTLITTNMPLVSDPNNPDVESLPSRLGDRVASRLVGMVDAVEMTGEDRRPQVRAEEKQQRTTSLRMARYERGEVVA